MRQEKQVVRDLGREKVEIHDLSDTGTADVGEAGEVI
jgi:hypothetical protein